MTAKAYGLIAMVVGLVTGAVSMLDYPPWVSLGLAFAGGLGVKKLADSVRSRP